MHVVIEKLVLSFNTKRSV